MTSIPISVLELAILIDGGKHKLAIDNTVKTAQHIEKLGFNRIWMAEHHNMQHVASSATSILIGHVASHTNKIRVGSGGIMLPNHSPLLIAEQFGTLETIYPGRIDLGLGRAPGTDQATAMALRRNQETAHSFPNDVRKLQKYFSEDNFANEVRAFPGEGLEIPIWILGSSTDSAYLAAEMGLPYAFASHFAPAQFQQASRIYKNNFKPSEFLAKPYLMACVNVIAADTNSEAEHLLSSLKNLFLGIITNTRKPLSPPGDLHIAFTNPEINNAVNAMLACTFFGGKEKLKSELSKFILENEIDELMMATHIYDIDSKLKSFSIVKEAMAS